MIIGTVRTVRDDDLGGELLTAHVMGADILQVDDVKDFNENGGRLTLNGDVYTYTRVVDSAKVIFLDSGLLSAADEGDAVLTVPVTKARYAVVETGDGPTATCWVDAPHRHSLPTGNRDADAGEKVAIEQQGTTWVVVRVLSADKSTLDVSDLGFTPQTLARPSGDAGDLWDVLNANGLVVAP